jgi:hypothetical protein
MPLNPIDVQMMVPRASEASRVQHVRDVVPQNDQQTLAGQEKTRHKDMQKQVQKSQESVKAANEEEKEKKKNKQRYRGQKNDGHDGDVQGETCEHPSDDPNRGHLIDYSI